MYKVLVIDISSYKEMITKTFTNEGYHVELSESAYDAMVKLKSQDFDLIVSEVELPGDNAFDLYNYINKYYPYIPTIMTTEKDIDTFFGRIFQEGIGNVLCKPFKRDEFVNLAEKLITKKNIFGLQHYMKNIIDTKKIRITSSTQINQAVNIITKQIKEWGFTIINFMMLNLLLNEMIINAVYHSHGYTQEKLMSLPIKLKDEEYVDIFFANNGESYGISINDYQGKLSKVRILESIHSVIEQNQLIMNSNNDSQEISQEISETGRGLDLVRKLANEYYFIIKKDIRTEIIFLYDNLSYLDSQYHTSLKIIEDIH
ncbi:MAG: response regulator [Spirochaetota bacterium]|nr:response regulator [Spirochaetota bacterium]